MALRTAVRRVMSEQLYDLDATIFREGEPSILDRAAIKKLASEWNL
jgi:hypothetical protein